MTRGLTKAREIEIETRRQIVSVNLVAGANYRDMASQLNVSIGTIANDVKIITNRFKREQMENVEDVVQTELRRLDIILNAIWPKVKSGDLLAIDRFLKIQDHRAKYLPLHAPNKLEVSGPGGGAIEVADIDKIRKQRWDAIQEQLKEALERGAVPEEKEKPIPGL